MGEEGPTIGGLLDDLGHGLAGSVAGLGLDMNENRGRPALGSKRTITNPVVGSYARFDFTAKMASSAAGSIPAVAAPSTTAAP